MNPHHRPLFHGIGSIILYHLTSDWMYMCGSFAGTRHDVTAMSRFAILGTLPPVREQAAAFFFARAFGSEPSQQHDDQRAMRVRAAYNAARSARHGPPRRLRVPL